MNFFKKNILLLSFLLLCLVFNTATAQQYNFKNYTTKNGLAASIVNAVFQDSKGYIWFGTQGGGISKFNGRTFTNYTKKEGLISNDITYITEDKLGNIWIATAEGVSKFDGVKFYNYSQSEGLSEGTVYWIYVDDDNVIWFAVFEAGVHKFDGKKITKITVKDGLPSNGVFCITQDKSKNYWFGTNKGIAKYDGEKITAYRSEPELKKKTVFATLLDSKGNLWFVGGSVVKYNGKSFEVITLPESVKDDFVGSVAEDKKGNIWFATDHGILKYENNTFNLLGEKQGLSSNLVLSVSADYEGNIWIGTHTGGVNLFNNESFVNFTDKEGLNSKSITCFYQYSANEYIVGTSGSGINIYDSKKNTFTSLSYIEEIATAEVFYAMSDNEGKLWIGSQEGVFILEKNDGKFKLIKSIYQFGNKKLSAALKIIQSKKDGAIWVATYGNGIFRLKDDIVKHYCIKKDEDASDLETTEIKEVVKEIEFVSNDILTEFEDSKGNIWIGTKDAGVAKYNGAGFVTYNEKNGLADKAVWSITEDKQGNLYFGTGENGISCYDGKSFKTISKKDGLCSNHIEVLQWDEVNDCFWIGTDKGINKIKLNAKFEIENLRYFGTKEGYQSEAINQGAILVDSQGLVWFGGSNGLGRYNGKYDFPNFTAPRLQLSDIFLAYQKVDWHKYADSVDSKTGLPIDLDLSYKNNNLTFYFQALTTDNVQYTFMLEGQHDEWSPLQSDPQMVFTNIAPGKTYTFKVKAVNSNGVWSKDVIEYTFTVSPPWWQTWWFYSISIILIVAGVYAYINYRTAQLAKEKKLLEEKVAERTFELKGANDRLSVAFNDIKDSINYAKKIQDAILPLDEEIKKALPQSFVLFKPRDVVSGDFYWFNRKDDKVYIAAVDCTGHGVPGAFMSMIGNSLLNEIVSTKGAHDAASILKELHQGVRKSLKQDRDSYESKDGMDLALTVIDTTKNTLQYAGAKRPLYCFSNNEFQEVKADKQSIGGLEMEDNYTFTNNNFELKQGDTFYLFTDGYVDQFGGEKGKKFSSKRLKETLEEIQALSMNEQGRRLDNIIEDWKSNIEQIDDILVIGIRF